MKNSYTLLFLLIGTSTLLAQTSTRTQVYVRAGVGTSRVNSTGQGLITLSQQFQYETDLLLTGTGSTLGLMTPNVGAGVFIDMSKHFTIGAELNVEQKGARATTDRLITYCTGGNCGIIYRPPTSIPASGQATAHLPYLAHIWHLPLR